MHIPKCQHLNSPWEVQWLNQPSSIHRESVGEANSSPDSCHVIWTQCKWSWLWDQGKVTSWMERVWWSVSQGGAYLSSKLSDSKQQSPRGDHTFSDNSLQGSLFASLGLILAPDLFTPPHQVNTFSLDMAVSPAGLNRRSFPIPGPLCCWFFLIGV